MVEVVKKLEPFIPKKVCNLKIIEENDDIENPSSCIKSSQFIKYIQVSKYTKESTSNKINEDNEIKKALANKIVELIFKEIDEEKDQKIRNQVILDNLNRNKITLLEIYNWLQDNQNEPNF